MASFAATLRRLRLAAGLTQERLAERSGVSPSTISELERGSRHAPQGASADMLAGGLGLSAEDRAAFFAAIAASRVPPGPRPAQAPALPEPRWPIHGREGELDHLRAELASGARWVTLVGEGGIGKTRLALELAHRLRDEGLPVSWAAAEALRTPGDVLPAIAAAMGVAGRTSVPVVQRIGREVAAEGRALVVLDNMEHLLDAAGDLQEMLDAAPGLALLATSRERFQVRDETVLALDPLPLPAGTAADDAAANPRVTLFFDRGAGRTPAQPSDADLAAAARIVRLLDGMPLAIELAAARRGMLSATAIADLLDQSGLRALGRWRDGPERFRSMEQTIRWSADLLPADARVLLRALSVFRGGFSPEAAARLMAGVGRPGAMAALPALLSASLAREVPAASGSARFAMLEPVRLAAAEDLAAAGEERAARDAHAAQAAAAAVAASARQLGAGGGEAEALAFFAAERANLLAALDHLLATGQGAAALPLANALGFWWELIGEVREGYGWLRRAIAADDGTAPARDRWLVRWLAALLALEGGDYAGQRQLADDALGIAREAGDAEGEAMAETLLAAWQQTANGDLAGALGRLDRAIGLAGTALGNDPGAWLPLAFASNLRGTYRHFGEGETERPLADFARSIATFRAYGSATLLGMPLVNMAAALQAAGQPEAAMAAVREAIDLSGRHDQPLVRVNAAMRLASLLSEEQDREAGLAAARLLGALEVMLDRQGFRQDAMMGGENAASRARLTAMLGPGLGEAMAAGRRLTEAAGGDPDLLALVAVGAGM
ncbi:MAG: ATP-binding protein [Chloroflexota bacterium]